MGCPEGHHSHPLPSLALGSISAYSSLDIFPCLLQEGNIFIVDYELLDGIDANKTDPCTHQFLAAPICLLYKNLANKIVPIAIQVGGLLASSPSAWLGSQE